MTKREILELALNGFSDLGYITVNRILKNYDEDSHNDNELSGDPITAIVYNAVMNNEADEDGVMNMVNNLDYAISELKRVREAISFYAK